MPLQQVVQLSDEETLPPPAPRLQAVSQLSDDEEVPASGRASSSSAPGPGAVAGVKRKRQAAKPSIEAIRLQLNKVICSKCRCCRKSRRGKPSCFAPFRKHMDKLANMQLGWREQLKEDMDRVAQHGFDN